MHTGNNGTQAGSSNYQHHILINLLTVEHALQLRADALTADLGAQCRSHLREHGQGRSTGGWVSRGKTLRGGRSRRRDEAHGDGPR